jgi:hypothetical protein
MSVEPGWARVYLNQKYLGETPIFRHPVPAGTHRVEVVAPDGRRQRRTLEVKSGAEARVTFSWPAAVSGAR